MWKSMSLLLLLVASLFVLSALGAPSRSRCAPTKGSEESVLSSYALAINVTSVTINHPYVGARKVSFYTTRDGDAVIVGDTLFDPEHSSLTRRLDSRNHHKARAFSAQDPAWPDATIKYRYASDDAEHTLKAIVEEAMKIWNVGAPFLRFQRQIPNNEVAGKGVLQVRTRSEGCVSLVGYAGDGTYMNLGKGCGLNEAVHELGHVLGLYHEHQRPDRDKYIKFNCNKLDTKCSNLKAGHCCDAARPANCCPDLAQFARYADFFRGLPTDSGGEYDLQSVMHYVRDPNAKPGDALFDAQSGFQIPTRKSGKPTSLDFKRIYKIYKKSYPNPKP